MNIALILAGGVGARMGMNTPKQFLPIGDKPVIYFTIKAFEDLAAIDKIVIVADPAWHDFLDRMIAESGITKVSSYAVPGKNRQLSIFSGLSVISEFAGEEDIVIIHDAVRPLVSSKTISDCILATKRYDGAVPAISVKDTIYISKNRNTIESVLDRNALIAGQTPESFVFGKYYAAHQKVDTKFLEKINGSSEFAVVSGMDIGIVDGDEKNIKITTADDLERVRHLFLFGGSTD